MKKPIYIFALACSIGILGTTPAVNIMTSYATESRTTKNYTIEEAYWDESDNKLIARWEEPEDKTAYKVQLFRNGKKLTSRLSTSAESYNFTRAIIDKGTGRYHFTVYSTKAGSGSIVTSDTLEIDSDLLTSIRKANQNTSTSGNTNSNNKNTNNSNSSTSGAVTGAKGGPGVATPAVQPSVSTNSLPIGWNIIDGKYYWNNAGTGLVTNEWLFVDGKWYFFGADSAMISGWLEWKGSWYYFAPSGEMLTNTATPDGYNVDANGVWIR